jgi:hypothetical protein
MEKKRSSFWYDGTEEEKPYTSLEEWYAEVKHLLWTSVILIGLFLISLLVMSTLTT